MTDPADATDPPPHLAATTREWWRTILSDYALEPHHVRQLQIAAEAWDRAQLAREELAEHGLTFRDQNGTIRANPCVAIMRDAHVLFNRTLRELDLDGGAPGDAPRPPSLPRNRR